MSDAIHTKGSIKSKLIASSFATLLLAFISVGIIVYFILQNLSSQFLQLSEDTSEKVTIELRNNSENIKDRTSNYFKESLRRKGENSLTRDSLVIKPFFLENSFNGLKTYLSSLFKMDQEIVYASFFVFEDDEVKAWQLLTPEHPEGLGLKIVYDKDTGEWVSAVNGEEVRVVDLAVKEMSEASRRTVALSKYTYQRGDESVTVDVYDCLIPVFDGEKEEFTEMRKDGEPIGYLRYQISLEKMHKTISSEKEFMNVLMARNDVINAKARQSAEDLGQSSMSHSIHILLISAVVVLILAYFLTRFVSAKVTQPIQKLLGFAKTMSGGDYGQQVVINSEDEIGQLGDGFELMRQEIKSFTEDLQGLVDEKTEEISNILDSIDQGIFTVGMDLKVNPQHSIRARTLFSDDFCETSMTKLMDREDLGEFQKWLKMISERRFLKRWEKYQSLNPIPELVREVDGEKRITALEYRPILNKAGKMHRLMVLGKDVTEKRKAEEALVKSKYEQEVQTARVISLVANNRNALNAFFEDLNEHMSSFSEIDWASVVEDIEKYFRSMHTLKGNAGSFGFTQLSKVAGSLEDILSDIRDTDSISDDDKERWKKCHIELQAECDAIEELKVKIFGDSDNDMVVNRKYFESLIEDLETGLISSDRIAKAVSGLDAILFSKFSKKYNNIIDTSRNELGKNIEDLHVIGGDQLVSREILERFDSSLIHVVRNAIDHGIESNDRREELDKGPGIISIACKIDAKNITISISDNGRGLDGDNLAAVAVRRDLISAEIAAGLSSEEKIQLVFRSGFTTRKEVSDISGRGIGMDAVKTDIEGAGGSVSFKSKINDGLIVILKLPLDSASD